MEEKKTKTKKTKVENNTATPTIESLTDELNQAKMFIHQMMQQQEKMNIQNLLKRLDILFAVLQHSDKFNEKFVENCAKEIEGLVTLEEQKEESNE